SEMPGVGSRDLRSAIAGSLIEIRISAAVSVAKPDRFLKYRMRPETVLDAKVFAMRKIFDFRRKSTTPEKVWFAIEIAIAIAILTPFIFHWLRK
ncbi:MAG: hypothetical protein ACREHG_08545, partial [Candidatus Saccharimonadales bacterium]